MKTKFYFALFISVLLFGCSKENSVNPAMERNIPGTWRIEKVNFTERNSWKCNDITHEYPVKKIIFAENKDLIFSGDQDLSGIWSLQKISCVSGDGSSDGYLLNMDAGNNLNLSGSEFSVTRKRMNFQVINAEGHYWFKLRKE